MLRRLAALTVLVSLVLFSPAATARTSPPESQRWKATIAIGGVELVCFVSLRPGAQGQWEGTIDIPMQGVSGAPLRDVSVSDAALDFVFAPEGAPFEAVFRAERQGDGAYTGDLTQAGQTMPLRMERLAADAPAGPARPQTPQPPFPYLVRDVEYENAAGGVRLAGTLTIPRAVAPRPAVLLITGSGAQDRDETIMGHKPFLVIADHLTRAGVAVLRVDDRGVGGTTGTLRDSTADDLASDVIAGLEFLAALPEVDARRLGLIGHSEGGTIAPLVAARRPELVSFMALLAGTGLTGREILAMQLEAISRAAGVGEASIERQLAAQRDFMDAIVAGDEAGARTAVRRLVIEQAGGEPSDPQGERRVEQVVEQQMQGWNNPWFRSFIDLDPREPLRRVRCPVLAMGGSLDLQVPTPENLAQIERALREGGNEDVTSLEMPGLNHLFQTARTGSPAEYATIEETFAPAAMEAMTRWILARTGG